MTHLQSIRKNALWLALALITPIYFSTIPPGHPIDLDDFAAYIMHASNIVNGRPYAALNYIPNPNALAMAPVHGYPPIFPLLLTPAYKLFGLNLVAMKTVVVLSFILFLIFFLLLTDLPLFPSLGLLIIVGFNPLLWAYRNYVLSEIPYLMFSCAALLMIERVYKNLTTSQWRLPEAFLTAVLIYLAYGTRTVGIAVLLALIVVDLLKFRRPSRFMFLVAIVVVILIVLQSRLISPDTYVKLTDYSPASIVRQAIFYGKTLSYVWYNGFNKTVQIIFALLFTSLAAFGFARSLRTKSVVDLYLIIYVGLLLVYSVQNGMRALVPIVPFYLFYPVRELSKTKSGRWMLPSLLVAVTLIYVASFRSAVNQPDIKDSSFVELCSFIRSHTAPTDVVVFIKPRTITLFTDRTTASLGHESFDESLKFLREIDAKIIIQTDWEPSSWGAFIVRDKSDLIFQNSGYKIFRLK
jgi:hypothetical protein